MRLEEFKRTLLPVEHIYMVQFHPRKDRFDHDYPTGSTVIYMTFPDSPYCRSVTFKGNVVKKFKEWLDSLNVQPLDDTVPVQVPFRLPSIQLTDGSGQSEEDKQPGVVVTWVKGVDSSKGSWTSCVPGTYTARNTTEAATPTADEQDD